MINGITWQELTQNRLLEAKKRQQKAKDMAKQAEIQANSLEEYIKVLEKALELDKQQSSITLYDSKALNPDNLLRQSTWENLRAIMALNNGLLVVVEAVDFLIHAKVFSDRDHARNVIYSTLHSHKKDVEWVRKGVYRLRKPIEKIGKVKKRRVTPNLKHEILEIKRGNPDFTKKDVTRTLIKDGFNFQGKNPNRVVHLTWVNMGYAKKEQPQQTSLIAPSTG